MNPQMFGGIAIITIITTCWSKIKLIFDRISSYIIVTVTIKDRYFVRAIISYMWQNYKKSPFGNRTYDGTTEYIRSLEKQQYIGYEQFGKTPMLFWNGVKPIFINTSGGKNDDSNTTQLTFIRKTFDIDQLLINAIDRFNDKQNSKLSTTRRFYVSRITGQDSNNANKAEKADKAAYDLTLGDRRILKWPMQDVGYQSKDPKYSLNILAFPKNVENIIEEIEKWKNSEKWYREKGIPWKRGWLLHGKPGTGKTSLIRGLAEYLDLPVFVYDISTLSNREMMSEWKYMLRRTPCIALIEDLDAVFDKRKNIMTQAMDKQLLSFDCLLNCLDGIEKTDGLFTVITTNRIDKLDDALGVPRENQNGSMISTRPGRIDRAIELKELDKDCRIKIAKRILCDFAHKIPIMIEKGRGDTGAQFQERCMQLALKLYWENK